MTRIPPEIIRASIKPGSVYYFHEVRYSSDKEHYFVVININPRTDEIILLACASSQLTNVNPNCPAETLVIITPEEYSGFHVPSIFDCNHIWEQSVDVITRKYSNNELSIKPEMDIRIVECLRHAAIASDQIAPRIKSMLYE